MQVSITSHYVYWQLLHRDQGYIDEFNYPNNGVGFFV